MTSSSGRRSAMPPLRPDRLLAVGGVLLLTAVSRLAVSAGVPTLWSPYPMAQFLMLSKGWPQWTCAAAALVLLILTAVAISRPSRGKLYAGALLGLLTLMTALYFVVFASQGLAHHGFLHVLFMAVLNVLFPGVLWWQWRVFSWPLPFRKVLAMSLVLSAWLFWCAFPYLGEGI